MCTYICIYAYIYIFNSAIIPFLLFLVRQQIAVTIAHFTFLSLVLSVYACMIFSKRGKCKQQYNQSTGATKLTRVLSVRAPPPSPPIHTQYLSHSLTLTHSHSLSLTLSRSPPFQALSCSNMVPFFLRFMLSLQGFQMARIASLALLMLPIIFLLLYLLSHGRLFLPVLVPPPHPFPPIHDDGVDRRHQCHLFYCRIACSHRHSLLRVLYGNKRVDDHRTTVMDLHHLLWGHILPTPISLL